MFLTESSLPLEDYVLDIFCLGDSFFFAVLSFFSISLYISSTVRFFSGFYSFICCYLELDDYFLKFNLSGMI
jgi:hypothetical protein